MIETFGRWESLAYLQYVKIFLANNWQGRVTSTCPLTSDSLLLFLAFCYSGVFLFIN